MSAVIYQNQHGTPGAQLPPPPAYTQPGQAHYPPAQQMHTQSHNVVVVTQPGQRVLGACPYCGIGFARTDYTLIGIIIAILFFPLGIICCMMMTERRCNRCGAKF